MPDKAIVVTGAAAGIGAAICQDLVAAGYAVIGVDLRERPTSAEGLSGWVAGDVGESSTHEHAAATARDVAPLVGWVNNAGIVESTALHAITDSQADSTLRTNLRGTFIGTRTALQSFLGNNVAGAIVNVSSIHARGAFPGTPAYDASKGGIEALTRYAAAEYGRYGIRVNAVAPGAIRTEMVAAAIAAAEDPAGLERDFASLHPLERLGEPQEVATVVRFLFSPDSSFISGAVIPVDGGAASRVFAFPPHPDLPAVTELS